MNTYKVNEIFHSIQGEGYHTGVPATFIRLQGCAVGCEWCDTKYTWASGGVAMSATEIAGRVKFRHVVVTGGEPTLYNLDPLLEALQMVGTYTQLETSGQQWLKGKLPFNWITLSPKPNLDWKFPSEYYTAVSEVKWVVDDTLTFDTVWSTWQDIWSVDRLEKPWCILMPEGTPPRAEMVEKTWQWLSRITLGEGTRQWRFGDRLQFRIGMK